MGHFLYCFTKLDSLVKNYIAETNIAYPTRFFIPKSNGIRTIFS